MSEKSEKVKTFLNRKLVEKQLELRKIKRKRSIIKGLYAGSVIVSVVLSSSAAAIASIFGLPLAPTIIITCFTTTSAIATILSTKFKLKKKKEKLQAITEEKIKIKDRLDYVVSCNGDLSESELEKILKEF